MGVTKQVLMELGERHEFEPHDETEGEYRCGKCGRIILIEDVLCDGEFSPEEEYDQALDRERDK